MLTLYRAEPAQPKEHNPLDRRPPQNVPYVVDNLWEWARPKGMPSRRGCEYASPDAASAKASATRSNLQLYRLFLRPEAVAVQIVGSDAKEHADIKVQKGVPRQTTVVKTLFELLNQHHTAPAYPSWASQPVLLKLAAAPLFLPVLSRKELKLLLGPGGPLADIAEKLRQEIDFWNGAKRIDFSAADFPNGLGEVFFKAGAVERKELVQEV